MHISNIPGMFSENSQYFWNILEIFPIFLQDSRNIPYALRICSILLECSRNILYIPEMFSELSQYFWNFLVIIPVFLNVLGIFPIFLECSWKIPNIHVMFSEC